MTTVFISWSGEVSREIAEELRNWIPSVLQFAKPYYTPNDIEKGAKWGSEISSKLAEANVGIVCLTKDNVDKPWILFEAGALSKDLSKSKVCSVLFGIDAADVSGPLSTFQATEFRKSEFKKMMASINESGGEAKLTGETFDRVFDMWWPHLEKSVNKILEAQRGEKADLRSDREILEEVLLLTRSAARHPIMPRPSKGRDMNFLPDPAVREMLDITELLMNIYATEAHPELHKPLFLQLELIDRLAVDVPTSEFAERISFLRRKFSDVIPF